MNSERREFRVWSGRMSREREKNGNERIERSEIVSQRFERKQRAVLFL